MTSRTATTRARPRRRAAKPASRDRAPLEAGTLEAHAVFAAVARYFGLLADPTRLRVLSSICHVERSVSAIVADTGIT